MRILTWNVAGFKKSNSLNKWDYSDVDLQYFAEEILNIDPDIITLQEVEFIEGDSTLDFMADLIGMKNFKGISMHPNHIGKGTLGYAVLSKDEITNLKSIVQPYPSFELKFADGKEAIQYNKNFVAFETFGHKITTLQLQPLHYWGYNYYEDPGFNYSKQLEQLLLSIDSDIITGDFQLSHLEVPFKNIMNNFKDSLPDEYTRLRNNGKNTKADHILLKNIMTLKESRVIKTQTDHFLCYCEV